MTMNTFVSLLKNEHIKLYRRKLFWVCLSVIVGIMALMLIQVGLSQANIARAGGELTIGSYMDELKSAFRMMAPQGVGGILMVIITSVFVASDYDWQTFGLYIRQGSSRLSILLAKFVALLLATALLMILATALMMATIAIQMTIITPAEISLTMANLSEISGIIIRMTLTLYPTVGLAMLITVLTRSQATGIGISLGYLLLVESLLPSLLIQMDSNFLDVVKFLPGQMVAAVQPGGMFTSGSAVEMVELPETSAALGLVVYVLLFIGISVLRFRQQDL